MFKNTIIKKQIQLLREENNMLRQAVPPDNQKYLPPITEKPPKKETMKDFIKFDFKKHAQIFGILGLVVIIAVVFVIEVIILNQKTAVKEDLEQEQEEEETETPEPISENTDEIYNTMGNSSSNIINDGIIAEQNDWLYYSNSSDNYFLYKMKKNGNINEKKRINAEPCFQINVIGDTVYYLNNETRAFYSIKTDGSNSQRINMLSCLNIQTTDKFIYYTAFSDGSLHKMNIDGSEDINLTNELKNPLFFVYEDDVYYT
ncbi:MAG: serine/threonine protein kinase, partial [Clostridia bacterium]|nr:serine/threonine protein kinase [Clostridia bacterium]